MSITKVELLQGIESHSGDETLSGGGAVGRGVVTEHQHAVAGHLKVDFHNVHTHSNDGFDGGNGVLGIVAPVAAVSDHDHILRVGVVHFRNYFFGLVGILGAAGCRYQGSDGQKEELIPFHIVTRLLWLLREDGPRDNGRRTGRAGS